VRPLRLEACSEMSALPPFCLREVGRFQRDLNHQDTLYSKRDPTEAHSQANPRLETSPSMSAFLGLDVAKSSCVAHLLTDGPPRTIEFENNPRGFAKLIRWLPGSDAAAVSACMEPTGNYHLDLATRLFEEGYTVFVANPWSVKQFGKAAMNRAKTDRADARVLAQFARAGLCRHPWAPVPDELAELTALNRRRDELMERKVALSNQRHSARCAGVKDSLDQELDFVKQAIREIDAAIRDHIRDHEDLHEEYRLLQSIPGIGRVAAAAIMAEMADWRRFDNADQLCAYAGLVPQPHESGESVRKDTPLCPLGSHRLRRACYMPGLVVIRTQALFPEFISRMRRESRRPKVIIAAIMRRLLRLAYGVLKTGKPYDPAYRPDRPQPRTDSQESVDAITEPRGEAHLQESVDATMDPRGETEAGPAGEQPAKGYPRGAQRPVIARGRLRLPHARIPSPSPGGRLPIPEKTH